jgi:hypothetical protein
MQVTGVTRVLASVSKMCDAGNQLVFNPSGGSYIISRQGKRRNSEGTAWSMNSRSYRCMGQGKRRQGSVVEFGWGWCSELLVIRFQMAGHEVSGEVVDASTGLSVGPDDLKLAGDPEKEEAEEENEKDQRG